VFAEAAAAKRKWFSGGAAQEHEYPKSFVANEVSNGTLFERTEAYDPLAARIRHLIRRYYWNDDEDARGMDDNGEYRVHDAGNGETPVDFNPLDPATPWARPPIRAITCVCTYTIARVTVSSVAQALRHRVVSFAHFQ
jgi:hypothetical protein